MTKEESNPFDPVKKLIQEAGSDTLGQEFHLSVLRKIDSLPKIKTTYEPVISPWAWRLIFIFITGIFGGSLLFLPSKQDDPSLFDKLPTMRFPTPSFSLYNFNLPSIEFSPQFLMSIVAFFILGFIMTVSTIRNKQADI